MPKRRRRCRGPFLIAVLTLLALVAGYVLGLAWFQSATNDYVFFSTLIIPRLNDVVIALWLLWVGSAIGSFLNVVAWRMPRGETVGGRSYCPRCTTQLRKRDNFPVFGWLALGGRCRTCRLPISPRYPIVEACVGLSLAVVGIMELYRLSIPGQQSHWHGGPLWTPQIDMPMLVLLAYHSIGVATVWAYGLIRLDGNRIPVRLAAFGIASVLIPLIAHPTLMVIPWQVSMPDQWKPDGLYVDALVRLLTAVAAAVFFARLLAGRLCPGADPKLDPLGKQSGRLIDLILLLISVSVMVGWQATPAVITIAILLSLVARPCLPKSTDSLGRLFIAMPVALTFQLTHWRRLHEFDFYPSAGSAPWVMIAWAAAMLILSLWMKDVSAPPVEQNDPDSETDDESELDDPDETLVDALETIVDEDTTEMDL